MPRMDPFSLKRLPAFLLPHDDAPGPWSFENLLPPHCIRPRQRAFGRSSKANRRSRGLQVLHFTMQLQPFEHLAVAKSLPGRYLGTHPESLSRSPLRRRSSNGRRNQSRTGKQLGNVFVKLGDVHNVAEFRVEANGGAQ